MQVLQEQYPYELLCQLRDSFDAALAAVPCAMPGSDLRVYSWVPAEPFEAFLEAVEQLTLLQGDKNRAVLM